MTLVRARAPLRLGLAGGGTDVAPYCDEFGGLVLNATIDRYAYAVIQPADDGMLRLHATDQQQALEQRADADLRGPGSLQLHRAVHRLMCDRYRGGERPEHDLSTGSQS